MSSKSYMKRDDVRGLYPQHLNGDVASAIGQAACERLLALGKKHPAFAVGYDCRHGNREIALGFALGVTRAGGRCHDLGLVSTEHVYYICGEHGDKYDAGAMITASHNPAEYNGIKMLHGGCVPFDGEDLAFIGRRSDEILDAQKPAIDFDEYASHLLAISGLDSRRPKLPFTVVVLAGNGMGALAFSPIAKLLEAQGLHSIILEGEPNGDFPQGVPNPLLPDFMKRLGQCTIEANADLGIGFDGDADRAGFVDPQGREIIPSQVLALIAEAKLKQVSGVVDRPLLMRNICCSQLLKHLFGGNGGVELLDTPVGHGRIKQLMRCNEYVGRTIFAGEHSGHYFYPEFHYADSGVLSSLYMISLAWDMKERGQSLMDKLSAWRRDYVWSGEMNYVLSDAEATMAALLRVETAMRGDNVCRYEICCDEAIGGRQRCMEASGEYNPAKAAAPDLKMVMDNGGSGWWFVLRPSGNEPKLRLNVEAWGDDAAEICQSLVRKLASLILK